MPSELTAMIDFFGKSFRYFSRTALRFVPGVCQRLLPNQTAEQWLEAFQSRVLKIYHRVQTPVVLYHSVEPNDHNPLLTGDIHNITPEILHAQLSFLKKHFSIVPVDEIVERLQSGKNVKGLGAVTFDDGYRSVFEHAAPVLEDTGITATVFLTTSLLQGDVLWRDKIRLLINTDNVSKFLDFASTEFPQLESIRAEFFYKDTKDPTRASTSQIVKSIDAFLAAEKLNCARTADNAYISYDELKTRELKNLYLGNHTHRHFILATLTKDEQWEEITTTERLLQGLGAERSRVFSIPFGGPTSYNTDTLEIVSELGYSGYLRSNGTAPIDAVECYGIQKENSALTVLGRFMPLETRWPWLQF